MNKILLWYVLMFGCMSLFAMEQSQPQEAKNSFKHACQQVFEGFCHCIEILLSDEHKTRNKAYNSSIEHSSQPVPKNSSVDTVSTSSNIESPRTPTQLPSRPLPGGVLAKDSADQPQQTVPKSNSWELVEKEGEPYISKL